MRFKTGTPHPGDEWDAQSVYLEFSAGGKPQTVLVVVADSANAAIAVATALNAENDLTSIAHYVP